VLTHKTYGLCGALPAETEGAMTSPIKDCIPSLVARAMQTPADVPTMLLETMNCFNCVIPLFTSIFLVIVYLFVYLVYAYKKICIKNN